MRTAGTQTALSDPQFQADVIERITALHWIGEPPEVAGVVVFMASPGCVIDHRRNGAHRRRQDRR